MGDKCWQTAANDDYTYESVKGKPELLEGYTPGASRFCPDPEPKLIISKNDNQYIRNTYTQRTEIQISCAKFKPVTIKL